MLLAYWRQQHVAFSRLLPLKCSEVVQFLLASAECS